MEMRRYVGFPSEETELLEVVVIVFGFLQGWGNINCCLYIFLFDGNNSNRKRLLVKKLPIKINYKKNEVLISLAKTQIWLSEISSYDSFFL